MEASAAAGIALIALVGLLPTILAARRLGLVRPVAVGLAVQALTTIGLFVTLGLWAPDAVKYHAMGQEIAAHLHGGPAPVIAVGAGKDGFPNLLGGLYWAFGPHAVIGLAVNWVAHGALVVVLSSAAHRIALPARRTAWLVALFPPLLLWSGLLLRESLAWLLIAITVLGISIFVNATDRKQHLLGTSYAVGGLLALTVIRGSAAIIIWVALALALTANTQRTKWLQHILLLLAMFAVITPQLVPIVGKYLPDNTDSIVSIQSDREESQSPTNDALTQTREALSREASTGFAGPDSEDPASMLSTASRIVAGPFPSEWNRVGLPFIADSILWLCVLSAAGIGAWRRRKKWRQLLILVIPALLLTGALATTSGNYGTMQRLRLQTTILLIPIAAACMPPRGTPRASRELIHDHAPKGPEEVTFTALRAQQFPYNAPRDNQDQPQTLGQSSDTCCSVGIDCASDQPSQPAKP